MEEDGTDRFERADSRHIHTHSAGDRQEKRRETLSASVANKQKTLDATLFNSQYGSDDDQQLEKKKTSSRAPSANKIPPCLVW